MKKRILLFLFSALVLPVAQRAHAQVVVIANPSVKAMDVSKAELRDLFSGVTSSLTGWSQVVPVLLKQGPVHDEFLTKYVGKSDTAFRMSWRSLVFSGQGVMPRSLESETAVVEFVARTPGAIGYVSKATPHEGVKILVVR